MDWKKTVIELRRKEVPLDEIVEAMQSYFPNLKQSSLYEKVRKVQYKEPKLKKKETVVGVVADLHIPFEHPNYLQFCLDTFKIHGVNHVVFIGDTFDQYAFSKYVKETYAMNQDDEIDLSIQHIKPWASAFGEPDVIIGNHDRRYILRSKEQGVGTKVLAPFKDIYELPKKWNVVDRTIIDDVLYKHGVNCQGRDGALNAAINERRSTVIGHIHSFGGCKYTANTENLIFGLNVGCGIDIAEYAFIYGEDAKYRPTLGCGIVYNNSYGTFVPMSQAYFRN